MVPRLLLGTPQWPLPCHAQVSLLKLIHPTLVGCLAFRFLTTLRTNMCTSWTLSLFYSLYLVVALAENSIEVISIV